VSVVEPPLQNVVAPLITGFVTTAYSVTVYGSLVALQPFAFVAVTVTVALSDTVIDEPVMPFDHAYDA
jgi:hypothetical protein